VSAPCSRIGSHEASRTKLTFALRLPHLVLGLPTRLQTRDRHRRQGRPIAEQAAQGQIEVAVRQAVQYNVGKRRPSSSVRRLNSGRIRLANRSSSPRTRGWRKVIVPLLRLSRPRAAEPVAIARRRVDHRPPLIPSPAEGLVHFFLEHLLQQPLHAVARERLQRRPFGA